MIVDTSALAAILFGEPEAALYTEFMHGLLFKGEDFKKTDIAFAL